MIYINCAGLQYYLNQRMDNHLGTQFGNDHSWESIRDDSSDEDAGLNWLGDLLDPWKGSKSTCHQSPPSAIRIYHKVSRQNNNLHVQDYCTQQAHQAQQKKLEETVKIKDDIIILDDDQQSQRFQIEMSSVSSERSILLENDQCIQIIDVEILEAQDSVDQQKQPPLSWSMIFNHEHSKNNEEIEPEFTKQAIKQQRNIIIGENEKVLEEPHKSQKLPKEYKSTEQLIFFNKKETVFSDPALSLQGKKLIPRRSLKKTRRLSIPDDLRLQFGSKPQSFKNQQRQTIKRKKIMKLQTKKNFNMLKCESNLRKTQYIQLQLSESEMFDLQDVDGEDNIDAKLFLSEQEVRLLQLSKEVVKTPPKNIANSQKPLTQRQLLIAKELESIIHVIKDKSSGESYDTIFKWEIGSSRYWKTLTDALEASFDIFIRKSKKYRSTFLKYLPKNVRSKKQGLGKLEGKLNGQEITELKREKIKECKVKSKRKEMGQFNFIFNKILINKVAQYQRLVQEKGRAEVVGALEDDYLSQYEPDTPYFQGMIEEFVLNANNSKKHKGKAQVSQSNVSKKVQATNQLLIHNLSKAADQYNYFESMRNLYKLNKKHSSLSCLDPNSLGLRSNDLKMINKETFESEMRTINLMNQPILVNDMETPSKNQMNHKLEGPIANSLKLQ